LIAFSWDELPVRTGVPRKENGRELALEAGPRRWQIGVLKPQGVRLCWFGLLAPDATRSL